MLVKIFSELVSDIIATIRETDKLVDTKPGTVIRDVFIDPVAQELSELYSLLDNIEKAQYIASATGDDLDAIAENYSLERTTAKKSTGKVAFYKRGEITEDIAFPLGTIVSTEARYEESPIRFETLSEEVILANESPTYYNLATGRYEIEINVRAVEAGENGNVPVNSIKKIDSILSGVDGVINNTATSGGEDKETDSHFRERLLLAITGASYGTVDGYSSLLFTNSIVKDVEVIGAGHSLMIRDNNKGGCVDIWVIHIEAMEVHTFTFNFNASAPNVVAFPLQPIKNILLVSGASFGPLTDGLHYDFDKDESGTGRSYLLGEDKIQMLPNEDLTDGEKITVTYNWNKGIKTLQDFIDSDAYKIVTADQLVRQAKEKVVDLTFSIKLFSGYLFSTVSTQVKTVISSWLNTFILGQDLKQGDIINKAYLDGVDDVIVPLTKLCLSGSVGVGNIMCLENEYIRPGEITVEEG